METTTPPTSPRVKEMTQDFLGSRQGPTSPRGSTFKSNPNAALSEQSVAANKKEGLNGDTRHHRDFPSALITVYPITFNQRTLYDSFQHACSSFPNAPCMGRRTILKSGEAGSFEFINYRTASEASLYLASGLKKLGLKDQAPVGLYSKNRTEWVLMEQACFVHKMITVALYDTFGPEALGYVVDHAELPLVAGSLDCINNLLKVHPKTSKIRHLVVFDDVDEEQIKKMKSQTTGWTKFQDIITFNELIALGKEHIAELCPSPPKPSDLAVIMYTSGTTGMPKGVLLTHANIIATIAGAQYQCGNPGMSGKDVYLSYLPLAHILERVVVSALLQVGAKVGFFQGDIKLLTADIAELRPTILAGVPRVFDKIHDGILQKIDEKGGLSKRMFDKAVAAKESSLAKGHDTPVYNTLVFAKAKKKLGGHVRLIISGGAPLTVETHKFIAVVFGCPVLQGYGLTETCAGCAISDFRESNVYGEVGPPLPCNEIKLVSVPEMNYLVTDDPPRGEIWVRGPNVSQGYYKDPVKTKEDFDSDGWFHSGDIGTWTARGTLKIIDRKKNIFKLAQGEYVPAEVLEQIYAKNRFTSQIWVYGNSKETSLIAVGSLNYPFVKEWGKAQGLDDLSAEDLSKNPKVIEALMAELTQLAKDAKRQGFEFIRAIHLHPVEFTAENDLATPTMKLKRPQLLQHFQVEINAMYKTINASLAAREKAEAQKEKAAKKSKPKEEKDKLKEDKGKDEKLVEKPTKKDSPKGVDEQTKLQVEKKAKRNSDRIDKKENGNGKEHAEKKDRSPKAQRREDKKGKNHPDRKTIG